MTRETLTKSCTFAFGTSAILLGFSHHLIFSMLLMAVAGGAWVMTLTGLSVTVQVIGPRSEVGRAIAIKQISILAGMAFGRWLWCFVANTFREETAFIATGVAMLARLLLEVVFPFSNDDTPDIH